MSKFATAINTLSSLLYNFEAEVRRLREQYSKKNAKHGQSITQLKAAQEEAKKAKAQVTALEENQSKLQAEAEQLRKGIEALKLEKEALASAKSTSDKMVAELNVKVLTLEGHMASIPCHPNPEQVITNFKNWPGFGAELMPYYNFGREYIMRIAAALVVAQGNLVEWSHAEFFGDKAREGTCLSFSKEKSWISSMPKMQSKVKKHGLLLNA